MRLGELLFVLHVRLVLLETPPAPRPQPYVLLVTRADSPRALVSHSVLYVPLEWYQLLASLSVNSALPGVGQLASTRVPRVTMEHSRLLGVQAVPCVLPVNGRAQVLLRVTSVPLERIL